MDTPKTHKLTWATIAASVIAVAMTLSPLTAWETWWHIAMGGIIDAFGAVPATNHLSYVVPVEHPSFIQTWLADSWLFTLDELGGVEGILSTRNLLLALAIFTSTVAAKTRSGAGAAALGVLGGAVAAFGMHAMPSMFAAPLFALSLWATTHLARSPKPAVVITAALIPPAITVIWANLDIAYSLPALLALVALAREIRQPGALGATRGRMLWSASILGSLIAPLANPRGVAIFAHTIELLTLYPGNPRAPLWSHLWSMTHGPLPLIVALVGLGAVLLARFSEDDERTPEFVVLGVALFIMALTHQRALLWFGLVIPVVAANLSSAGIFDRVTTPTNKLARAAMITTALIIALVTQPSSVLHKAILSTNPLYNVRTAQPHAGVVLAELPVAAGEFMSQYEETPRVYASEKYSGYIIYKLSKRRVVPMVFSDPRIEQLTPKQHNMRDLLREQPGLWRGVFQGYDVSLVLLSKAREAALIKQLVDDATWQTAHETADAIYMVRVAPMQ